MGLDHTFYDTGGYVIGNDSDIDKVNVLMRWPPKGKGYYGSATDRSEAENRTSREI